MEILFNSGAKGGQSGKFVKEGDTASFVDDVVEMSMQVPVVVDFWAPWCGPCKTLGPLLEKLVNAANGAVRMVKINVDKNQELAAQMRIQSIPAVYAFKGGRPVDGFVGAVTESQVKAFIQRLVGDPGGKAAGIDEILTEAKDILAEGDVQTALQIYQEVLAQDPQNVQATAGTLRCLVQGGQVSQAKRLLAGLPAELVKAPDIAAAAVAIELAEQAKEAGSSADLRRKLTADANDHQARYDLAMAYYAAGEYETAVEELLELFRRNRNWNEDAARKQLVKLFDAFGPSDPLTVSARRRLSSLMFS